MTYERPIIKPIDGFSESVFAASGASADNGGVGCDSKYMLGTYQHPDYSNWAQGEKRGYKKQFGCLGCPAFTESGCGLLSHYQESGQAESYEVDNGNRMPSWERKGYKPDDAVTDWNM